MTATQALPRVESPAHPTQAWRRHWPLIAAGVLVAAPVLYGLATTVWTTEQGAHGPIILFTGLWLLLREGTALRPLFAPGKGWLAAILIVGGAPVLLLGHATGWAALAVAGAYVLLIAALYLVIGGRALARLWFPLVYLAFLIPPPQSVMAGITLALKLGIASRAVDVMSWAGFQVALSGPDMYIDQYQLVVAAACSGMNTLVSLMAIGLFYIYLLHRSDWRYALLLAALILPIAVAANFVRVLCLMLLMHYGGESWAEGLLHQAAGLFMFFVALGLLVGIDSLLAPLRHRLSR
ncbi:exosortase [Sphingomonas immobilis]|uniref:Exosortase n=1 Tax=Sphingomonas immobilis TaxID=3063997 RepID=A0ABT9A1I6_9SPHN|nr:exosortase [Sphingomonas sp. CA1-15]MDO7843684.1 exosortase [Sphingomonas sp. CA1-15]